MFSKIHFSRWPLAAVLLPAWLLGLSLQMAAQQPEPAGEPSAVTEPNLELPAVAESLPPPPQFILSDAPTQQELRNLVLFEMPLIATGQAPKLADNAALAKALKAHVTREPADDFSALEKYLQSNPNSPWSASVLTNLGLQYFSTGWFSKTIPAWEKAWSLSRTETGIETKAVADHAIAELINMHARLGHAKELKSLLKEIAGRSIGGAANEIIAGARQGLWLMQKQPDRSYPEFLIEAYLSE